MSEQIKKAGFQIHDSLVHGAIHTATETIWKLSVWFEDLIWKSYLKCLLQCEIIMLWLRALGAQKGFRLVSYQQIWVTLPTGTKIQIRSPFFVKACPKRGRKKRGPNNRGEHLFLLLMGFVHKVEPSLAFLAVKLAVLAPSFDTASKIFAQEGIKLSPNKIKQMVTEMRPDDLSSRVERLIGDKESCPLKKRRVLLCVDGGRLRQRKNKRGSRPEGAKRCGYHTDWIESKLFTIYLIDEEGDIIKKVSPLIDSTN